MNLNEETKLILFKASFPDKKLLVLPLEVKNEGETFIYLGMLPADLIVYNITTKEVFDKIKLTLSTRKAGGYVKT